MLDRIRPGYLEIHVVHEGNADKHDCQVEDGEVCSSQKYDENGDSYMPVDEEAIVERGVEGVGSTPPLCEIEGDLRGWADKWLGLSSVYIFDDHFGKECKEGEIEDYEEDNNGVEKEGNLVLSVTFLDSIDIDGASKAKIVDVVLGLGFFDKLWFVFDNVLHELVDG